MCIRKTLGNLSSKPKTWMWISQNDDPISRKLNANKWFIWKCYMLTSLPNSIYALSDSQMQTIDWFSQNTRLVVLKKAHRFYSPHSLWHPCFLSPAETRRREFANLSGNLAQLTGRDPLTSTWPRLHSVWFSFAECESVKMPDHYFPENGTG